jgi:hypothetical protein
MTITSVYYDTDAGTPASLVTEVKWAKSHPHIGSSIYGVDGIGDFQVTAHASTPLAVNVAAGKAWGWGIFDESDATVTLVCDPPPAGSTRWDLICLRRDWTADVGGPTTVAVVQGGTSRVVPAGREDTPGTIDDQPLALVQWTSGSTQPTSIVDLRIWGGDGGLYAKDPLVRTFLSRIGTEVNVAGILWQQTIGAGDIPWWTRVSEVEKVSLFGTSGAVLQGSITAGQTGFYMQAGTYVGHTDSAGYGRVTFPRPFPNGLLTVVLVNGDSSIDRARGTTLTPAIAGAPWNNGTKVDFIYTLMNSEASMMGNTLARINWIAIGW